MARRFVLSTVGTSLFTNVLAPAERQEWVGKLNSQSNETAFPPVVAAKVDELSQRVRTRLREGDVPERRRLSAELNGLYGLYGEKLSADGDVHYLIATDTALGKTAADVVRDFLRQQGLNITVHVPERLNTASTTHFSHGMKALLKWCEDTIPGFRTSGYEVIFNLTGGFKSLQL